jgi:hypothetical protein
LSDWMPIRRVHAESTSMPEAFRRVRENSLQLRVLKKRRRKRRIPRDFKPYDATIFQRMERALCTGLF